MENPYRSKSKVNPQRGDGHREIENCIFRALISANLSGGEYKVVLYIIDRTWGWGKYSTLISLSQYKKATHLSKQGIVDAIYSLEKKRIICAERNGTKGTEYLFNKHYDTWDIPLACQVEWTSQPAELAKEPEPQLVKQSGQGSGEEEALLVNQSGQAEEVTLVNQSGQGLSSGVDKGSQVELTTACQPPEASPTPAIKTIKETSKESIKEIYTVIFDHWTSLSIISHKKMTDKMKAAVKSALGDYSKEEICQAMSNYAEVLQGEEYFWKYKWTLDEFIRRGLEKFMDAEVARENYRMKDIEMRGGKHDAGKGTEPGRGPGAHREDVGEGGRFSGFRAIKSGSGEPDDRDED